MMENKYLFSLVLLVMLLMAASCSTSKKVVEKLVYVHDTVSVKQIDTLMVNQQSSYASSEQIQHLTQRIDSVIERTNTTVTLGANGDTTRIVQIIHTIDKSKESDSVVHNKMESILMQLELYKSSIDSLKKVNETLLSQKEIKKKSGGALIPYNLILICILTVLCIAILKSREK